MSRKMANIVEKFITSPYMTHTPTPDEIKQWREMPTDRLALLLAKRTDVDAPYVLQQAEGWQKLRTKVPSWAAVDALQYPHRLALEQCSGEAAARAKAEIIGRIATRLRHAGGHEAPLTYADLTGGLGVDFSFIAPRFDRAVYVERQAALCELARHNFPLLGLEQATVVCADGTEYLHSMERTDVVFLDPARRDGAGRKTVLITDCEPDVCNLQTQLLDKARCVVLKLSTMLDIAQTLKELQAVCEVHILSTRGECKDLLVVMSRDAALTAAAPCGPLITAHDDGLSLSFTAQSEAEAQPEWADCVDAYLYEPGAAVLKAGAFKTVAVRYGLKKLHPHSHLYTGPAYLLHFPGRKFKPERVFGFSKADLKQLRTDYPQANLTIRNFPSSVDALRKKLKLREGGTAYIFATTLADGKHVLIVCRKAEKGEE